MKFTAPPKRPVYGPRAQRGQIAAEYIIVAAALVLVLYANPSVLQELMTALRLLYTRMAYAIGNPSVGSTCIVNC